MGVVTTLIKRGPIEPGNSIVMICGPEVMLRYSVQEILGRGLSVPACTKARCNWARGWANREAENWGIIFG